MRGSCLTRLVVALTLSMAAPATAQSSRCRVMDPTGTPLNLREAPGGRIVGQISNQIIVERGETVLDGQGRSWTRVMDHNTGRHLGYVFREFIACF